MKNLFSVEGKTVLITGGSRGIGEMIATGFVENGAKVYITARKAQACNELAEELSKKGTCISLPFDLGTMDGIKGITAELEKREPKLDVLINNAGAAWGEPIDEYSESGWDKVQNINLKGVFFLTQALLPLLADGGRIVNISSGLTRFALPGHAAYAAAKTAVETFTRYLAKELGPRGITANVVAPGAIETDFSGGVVRDDPELNGRIAASTALGRAGVPQDIGPMIAALLGDANRWVNAQRIEVSGGQSL